MAMRATARPLTTPTPTHSQVLGFGRSTPLPKSGSKNATADELDSMGYARATVADRRGLAEPLTLTRTLTLTLTLTLTPTLTLTLTLTL